MPGSRPRVQVVSRSTGRKACAMAAYRAGAVIEDGLYLERHDYSRREGVLYSEIMAPEAAPAWVYDREALWNAVEASEINKDGSAKKAARLAREIMVPLPHELDFDASKAALREWIDHTFVRAGMVADFSIHAPDRTGDQRNFHAHVMLTMREIGPDGFSQKKASGAARSWNDKGFMIDAIAGWERIQNRELERAGIEARADFSSFAERGIEAEPEIHEGVAATQMKRREAESRLARENAERKARNSAHWKAVNEIVKAREERERFRSEFAEWQVEKAAQLDSAQRLNLLDLEREQERIAYAREAELQAYYAPQIAPVVQEAERLAGIVHGRGFVAGIRRLWQGRADREKLERLQATINATRERMQEARAKLERQHQQERQRVIDLQAQRRQEQAAGFEKREAERLAAIEARETAARAQASATLSPKADLEREIAQARDSREAWKAARRREIEEAAERLQESQERGVERDMDGYEP